MRLSRAWQRDRRCAYSELHAVRALLYQKVVYLFLVLCFRVLFFSHDLTCSFAFSLPSRNSGPGALGKLFSLLSTVRAFFFIARRRQPILPSATLIDLARTHTLLGAVDSVLFIFFAHKVQVKSLTYVGFKLQNQLK